MFRKDNQRKKNVSESSIDEGFSALSCEEGTVQYSPTVRRSRTRNSYKNPVNNEQITWIERRMDAKPLSSKIGTMESFFQQVGWNSDLGQFWVNISHEFKEKKLFNRKKTEHAEWRSIDHIPGNCKVWYACLNGARPMGMVKIEPGGYFKLHWHAETEHYLIVSGHGRFTIGTEERDIVATNFPTLITIPGNVPHQTFNPGKEDLIWYYYFPEADSLDNMRYFYPCGARTEIYARFPSCERSEVDLKSTISDFWNKETE